MKKNSIGSSGSTGSDPSNESKSKSYGRYNKHLFKKFKNCFNKRENTDELFTSMLTSSKLNNYSGLTYIKGLRGISMVGLVVGCVYFDMLNHPSTIFGEYAFVETFDILLLYVLFPWNEVLSSCFVFLLRVLFIL